MILTFKLGFKLLFFILIFIFILVLFILSVNFISLLNSWLNSSRTFLSTKCLKLSNSNSIKCYVNLIRIYKNSIDNPKYNYQFGINYQFGKTLTIDSFIH